MMGSPELQYNPFKGQYYFKRGKYKGHSVKSVYLFHTKWLMDFFIHHTDEVTANIIKNELLLVEGWVNDY